jgi:hypothetical protein
MIVSLPYKLTRALLSIPALVLRRDSSNDAELFELRHENAVPRHQITGPVRYVPPDRYWLPHFPRIPRPRWMALARQ